MCTLPNLMDLKYAIAFFTRHLKKATNFLQDENADTKRVEDISEIYSVANHACAHNILVTVCLNW